MSKKLNNLLKFSDFDSLDNNKKSTKRTEIGGDILNEHHMTTKEDKTSYINDKINMVSDELIDTIYNLIESEIE
jgi:hypothetical protein